MDLVSLDHAASSQSAEHVPAAPVRLRQDLCQPLGRHSRIHRQAPTTRFLVQADGTKHENLESRPTMPIAHDDGGNSEVDRQPVRKATAQVLGRRRRHHVASRIARVSYTPLQPELDQFAQGLPRIRWIDVGALRELRRADPTLKPIAHLACDSVHHDLGLCKLAPSDE
jgi:hypothetical protein